MSLHLTIPQNWNDLSSLQIENICHALHCNQQAIKVSPEHEKEVNTATFLILSRELLRGNGFFKVRKALKELRVKAYQDLVAFLYNGVHLHVFPETIKLFKDKHKQYFKTTFYGPYFRLKNMTIGEFSFADAIYYRWKDSNNIDYLNLLVATLYREKAKKPLLPDDVRVPFSKINIESNLEVFAKLPLKKKLAIAYAFEGSRNHIVSMHPLVFPKSNSDAKTKIKPKYVPFGELISHKIKYDPSKIDEVENINLYKFFAIYQNELKEIRKIKKK